MERRNIKWWKVLLTAAMTIAFLYMTVESIDFERMAYSNWVVNHYSVQERLYEATGMMFMWAMVLEALIPCLVVSLMGLIRCFFPRKKPTVFARMTVRFGIYPVLVFLAVCLVLAFADAGLMRVIINTPEVDEAPATLAKRMREGWICLAAQLAFEGTIVMFVAWLRSRTKKMKQKGNTGKK